MTNYRYAIIKVENGNKKKEKDYGKRGDSLSAGHRKFAQLLQAKEGKPQKKVKI